MTHSLRKREEEEEEEEEKEEKKDMSIQHQRGEEKRLLKGGDFGTRSISLSPPPLPFPSSLEMEEYSRTGKSDKSEICRIYFFFLLEKKTFRESMLCWLPS